jgi:hypothetical protein
MLAYRPLRDAGRVTRDPRLPELANPFKTQHAGEELLSNR